jgi:hypothetical protein
MGVFKLIHVFLVSGIVGLVMKHSSLFPILKEEYYDRVENYISFVLDGLSGIIVAVSFVLIKSWLK